MLSPGAKELEHSKVRHAPRPSEKIGSRFELLKILPQDDQDFLHDVFGVGHVGNERRDEMIEPHLVLPEQFQKARSSLVVRSIPGFH